MLLCFHACSAASALCLCDELLRCSGWSNIEVVAKDDGSKDIQEGHRLRESDGYSGANVNEPDAATKRQQALTGLKSHSDTSM